MNDDVTALVERLEAYAKDQGGWHNIDETCEAAASAIKAQAAEIERLGKNYYNISIDAALLYQEKEAAEAKLREAVEVMRAINRRASPDPTRTFDDAIGDLEHITAYARTILSTMGKS